MKASLSIASLLISLTVASNHNETFETTEWEFTSTDTETTYYTTFDGVCTLEDMTADTDPDCDLFSLDLTLDSGENIEAELCGYTEDETKTVLVTLTLPTDVWFGIGFKTEAEASEVSSKMYGYALIVPICSRDIQERFLTAPGVDGLQREQLDSTVDVIEDTINDDQRVIRLKRELTVDDLSNYFDFENFLSCEDDPVQVIYAWGAKANVQFAVAASASHGSNKGAETVTPFMVGDDLCDVESAAITLHVPVVLSLFVSALCAYMLN